MDGEPTQEEREAAMREHPSNWQPEEHDEGPIGEWPPPLELKQT